MATAPEKVSLADTRGFQHAGRDQYYYRPLVAGDGVFTYVAHVPAGGDMPADQEEAELFELSLFMIEGELEATLGGLTRTLSTGDAQHIPRGVAFGVANRTDHTASFVLSFTPPPGGPGLEPVFADAQERGARIWNPSELNAIRAGGPGPDPA